MSKGNSKGMPKGRNATAMIACFKKGGTFHHKCSPRGGARNDMSEFLDMWEDDAFDSLNDPSDEHDYCD